MPCFNISTFYKTDTFLQFAIFFTVRKLDGWRPRWWGLACHGILGRSQAIIPSCTSTREVTFNVADAYQSGTWELHLRPCFTSTAASELHLRPCFTSTPWELVQLRCWSSCPQLSPYGQLPDDGSSAVHRERQPTRGIESWDKGASPAPLPSCTLSN
jgi:hypothetical protein